MGLKIPKMWLQKYKILWIRFGCVCQKKKSPPLCSPATESIAEPPLSEPTLPPCSAGEVRSVEPSVAAVLPSSSDAGAEIKAIAVTANTPQSCDRDTWPFCHQLTVEKEIKPCINNTNIKHAAQAIFSFLIYFKPTDLALHTILT